MATEQQQTPPPSLRNHGGASPTIKLIRQKIWRRLNVQNQHFMGVIVGREGFGKSHSALSIAKAVDPSFTAEDVYFDPKGLLEAFKSDDYSSGDMIVLDEAGVGMGNRTWYEKSQVLLNQTLQTVRDDNMGVVFTLPRLTELDSQTKGRLHAFIEMTAVRKDDGYAMAKWKNVDPSRGDVDKIYYKYSDLSVEDAEWEIQKIKIGKPPEDLVKRYEKRKETFKDDLYEEAIAAQEDEDEETVEPSDVADEVVDEGRVDEFVSTHPQNKIRYVDADLLKAEYGLSVRKAKAAKKLIEREVDIE
jgi:hypothetical protein